MRDQMTSELAQDANAHWQQRLVSTSGSMLKITLDVRARHGKVWA